MIEQGVQGKAQISIKTGASELLSIFPVLRYYVDSIVPPDPRLAMQRTSLRLACDMVSAILECKQGIRSRTSTATLLSELWPRWMKAHKKCYQNLHLKPESHWTSHLGPQFMHLVIDMFVIERLNKRAKSCTQHVHNFAGFERSGVLTILLRHLGALAKVGDFGVAALQGAIADRSSNARCKRASNVKTRKMFTFSVGDLVFNGSADHLGEILDCCAIETDHGQHCFVEVRVMQFIFEGCHRSAAFVNTPIVEEWALEHLFHASAWGNGSDGRHIVVLR